MPHHGLTGKSRFYEMSWPKSCHRVLRCKKLIRFIIENTWKQKHFYETKVIKICLVKKEKKEFNSLKSEDYYFVSVNIK